MSRGWTPWLVAGWAGVACLAIQLVQPGTNDWSYFWTAAHALWQGENPYAAVRAMGSYPLYYPGPAVLVLAPFGLLPIRVGWLAFALVSGYLFGLAARRYGRGLPAAGLSAAFLEAVTYGQWTPVLVAGAVMPVVGGVLAAKPSVGLALYAWRPHRWAVIGGLSLTVLSFVFMPSWPVDWLASLRETNHVAPVLRPWGFLLLLAALRWRTPEGRLLLVLSLVPQTTSLHGTLPLFLIPRSKWEGYALASLSLLVAVLQGMVSPTGETTIEAGLAARWPLVFAGCYLPALVLVLRPERG